MSWILRRVPENFEPSSYTVRHCDPDWALLSSKKNLITSVLELKGFITNLPKFSYVSVLTWTLNGEPMEFTDDWDGINRQK